MKKLLSILLALTMMLSLFGVAALADGDAEEVAETEEITADTVAAGELEETASALKILVTGEVGLPSGEETASLTYAAVAALKEYYAQSETALLVDAGGFDATAISVMEKAGYDLAVTEDAIASETLVALTPVVNGPAGAMVSKSGMTIAFIGIQVPETEETGEDVEEDSNAALYEAIQESIDKAAEADYVILLGSCADVKTLMENISGVDAILTNGEGPDLVSDCEENDVVLLGVEAGFGTVGVLTVDPDGINAEVLDADEYAALELTEDEELSALEETWIQEANQPEEEQPEETEEPTQADAVMPTPAVTPANDGGEAPAEDGEETPAEDGEETPAEDGEETPAEDGEETPAEDGEEAPAEDGEEAPAEDGEEAPAEDGEEAPAEDGEEAPAEDGEEAPAEDGEEAPAEDGEEAPAEDGEEAPTVDSDETPSSTPETERKINWTKGVVSLQLTFDARVSELKVGSNTLSKDTDYTLSNDGTEATISANMLNGWNNGTYEFTATFPDGSKESVFVVISGEAPAATPVTTPEATATPEPTAKQDEVISWTKGIVSLQLTFDARVSELKVGGNTLSKDTDYTLSNDGTEATISANMLNGWGNAKYEFVAIHPDGSKTSRMVSITGDYATPTPEQKDDTDATATPAATKTPSGTPNTGDTSPIWLYVVILVVLVVALVVVLVMTGKKKRK